MKAFVIKVKKNCYWLGGFYGKNNYDDIAHAKVYVNKTQAEKQCKLVNESYGHNAKVVEITIVEEDKNLNPQNYENLSIEDKLKYRDEQVRLAVERSVEDYNKITDLEFHIKRLEEQLTEKDKEINKLSKEHFEMFGDMKDYKNLWLAEQRKNKEIRKQVCDEIRDFIQKNESPSFSQSLCGYWFISAKKLFEYLDQIEQAKENMK